MTAPRARVRATTGAEADRQRLALDTQLRQLADNRTATPATASPYDLLADALHACITDQVFAAIQSPDFAAQLAERGYRIVPAVPAGTVPEPPGQWLHDALDLYCLTGEPADLLGHTCALWESAWTAGREAGTP